MFFHLSVSLTRFVLEAKCFPEFVSLLTLIDDLKVLVGVLVALKKWHMILGSGHILLLVDRDHFCANPEIKGTLSLNDWHASGLEPTVTLTSFKQIDELELGHDHLRIVILDTHDGEHAWVDCQCIEVGMILKTVLEPDQLLNEAHVGVSTRSSFLNSLVTLLVSDAFS